MLAVFGVTSLHTADTDGFSLTRFRELVPMLPGLYPSWNMVDMENIESRAQRWGKRIGAVGVLLWIYNRIASQGIVIKNNCHVEWKSNRIYQCCALRVVFRSFHFFNFFVFACFGKFNSHRPTERSSWHIHRSLPITINTIDKIIVCLLTFNLVVGTAFSHTSFKQTKNYLNWCSHTFTLTHHTHTHTSVAWGLRGICPSLFVGISFAPYTSHDVYVCVWK